MAIQVLWITALVFAALAVFVKGREALAAARRAEAETRINLSIHFLDVLFIAPLISVAVEGLQYAVTWSGLALTDLDTWASIGTAGTVVAALFVGDFIAYWRHRFEHTRLVWPSHAIHHSDREMTWLTLSRFHPINRVTTAVIDVTGIALVGIPAWAIVAYILIRHFYGQFIHADLPWTYGPLKRVFVSPVMHRWHHARGVVGAGNNFATIFSVFDQIWGTFYCPGLCTVPLGVKDDMGPGVLGQLRYPFVAWAHQLNPRPPTRA